MEDDFLVEVDMDKNTILVRFSRDQLHLLGEFIEKTSESNQVISDYISKSDTFKFIKFICSI